MLKKTLGAVAVAAGLALVGGPAFAGTMPEAQPGGPAPVHHPTPTFGDAYHDFIHSGGHAGAGAAGLVASAYTGVAETPALVAHSAGNQ